jgi:G3E family GTPase
MTDRERPEDNQRQRTSVDNLSTLSMLTGLFQAAQIIPPTLRAAKGSLPLTVISGFLGAGKTTLLNRLLTQPHGRKIAVIVNDFGAINIDAALIRGVSSDTIELTNGCACCTVAGDLTRTLVQIAQREDPPECIVLEASGAADPQGITLIALSNPSVRFDGIVTLVDADTIEKRLSEPAVRATVEQQIKAADLILLNKCDLVSPTSLPNLRSLIKTMTSAPIIETVNAEAPIDLILGLSSTRLPDPNASVTHDIRLSTWSRTWKGYVDLDQIRVCLRELPDDVLRAKGIFMLSDQTGTRSVYHRVGQRESWTSEPDSGSDKSSALVIIGPTESVSPSRLNRLFGRITETEVA